MSSDTQAATGRTIAALCLMTVLLIPAAAVAQGLGDQAEAAVSHAGELAGDVTEDPGNASANATDPSWQGQQANWTQAWTCETGYAASPEAHALLVEAGTCPPIDDATAGEDEEDAENETTAEAEELENDTAAAVEDEVAAAEAFVDDTKEDPENATSHLLVFLNRTQTIVERLLGLPAAGLGVAGQALGATGGALLDAGHAVAQATKTGAGAITDATLAVIDGTVDGLGAIVGSIGDGLGATLSATQALATGTLDGTVGLAKTTGGAIAGVAEASLGALGGAVEATAQATAGALEATVDLAGGTVRAIGDAVGELVPGRDAPTHGPGGGVSDVTRQAGDVAGDGLDLPVDVPADA